ncbi:MAG: polymer-forming cytoskeletal protein [Pseudomonadota bacterium]
MEQAAQTGDFARFTRTDHIPATLIVRLATANDTHPRGVRIEGATIDGALDFEGRTLPRPLLLVDCAIPAGIRLHDASCGNLFIQNCTISGGINAQRLRVDGSFHLRGSKVTGAVDVMGGRITCDFSCRGATFDGGGEPALQADAMQVGGTLFLNGGFTATGPVRLPGASVTGNVTCTYAKLNGGGEPALHADGLRVHGDLFFREGFEATGTVRLLGAAITGDLDCSGAKFDGAGKTALQADGIRVGGGLFFRDGANASGLVDLTHAKVGVLADDRDSWPQQIGLSGFTYGGLGGDQAIGVDAVGRIEWLGRGIGSHFDPQPYEHLAKVFREMGRMEDYREVHIAKEWRRMAFKKRRRREKHADPDFPLFSRAADWLGIVWGHLIGWTAGFGYKPWRVAWPMLLVILVGMAVFKDADRHRMMVPAKERVYMSDKPLPIQYPRFNALVYSMDVFFPIVDLHQEDYWQPSIKTDTSEAGPKVFGRVARVYLWVHILLGWFLTALGVAGVTGLVKKEQ